MAVNKYSPLGCYTAYSDRHLLNLKETTEPDLFFILLTSGQKNLTVIKMMLHPTTPSSFVVTFFTKALHWALFRTTSFQSIMSLSVSIKENSRM
jgi:hypothetical protein